MARIRSIKPEFWSDEQVMECSPMARLMFIGIWNFCDDAGNHPLSEKTIKALVFPGDSIDSASIRRLLVELSSNALLRFYECSGKAYLNIKGWRHQKIDRPTIKHPDFYEGIEVFPDDLWPAGQVVDEQSTSNRRVIDEPSPPEEEGKGNRKGKGEDQEHLSPDESGDVGEQPSGKKPEKPIPFDWIMARYNEICGHSFKGAATMTAERKKNITKCWARKVNGIPIFQSGNFWKEYFAWCLREPRWHGKAGESWKASLEFLTRHDIVDRVIDEMVLEGVLASE